MRGQHVQVHVGGGCKADDVNSVSDIFIRITKNLWQKAWELGKKKRNQKKQRNRIKQFIFL
jgi:hypothetical protein